MIDLRELLLTSGDLLIASTERISRVPFDARAHGHVTDHRALSVKPAGAWTGVLAFLTYTSLVTGTLGVDGTFRSAVWRAATIVRQAGAGWRLPHVLANRVWTTGGWQTGVSLHRWRGFRGGFWRTRTV